MAVNVSLAHTFAGLSGTIPLSYLDDDYVDLTAAFGSFNSFSNYLTDTGAADAYAASLGVGLTGSVANGLMVQLKIANTNTTASTFAFNGTTAKNIKNMDGTAMTAGQLIAGGVYNLVYDGTQWILVGLAALISAFTATLTGCTTTPTFSVKYVKIATAVTLTFPATAWAATSNTTAKTLTGMPASLFPAAAVYAMNTASDNGGAFAAGLTKIGSDGVIHFYPNPTDGGLWTNSGTANVACPAMAYSTS